MAGGIWQVPGAPRKFKIQVPNLPEFGFECLSFHHHWSSTWRSWGGTFYNFLTSSMYSLVLIYMACVISCFLIDMSHFRKIILWASRDGILVAEPRRSLSPKLVIPLYYIISTSWAVIEEIFYEILLLFPISSIEILLSYPFWVNSLIITCGTWAVWVDSSSSAPLWCGKTRLRRSACSINLSVDRKSCRYFYSSEFPSTAICLHLSFKYFDLIVDIFLLNW